MLDCYKIIYLNLLGLRVSDIFIKSATQRILGDYFMHYSRRVKPKHVDKKHFLTKALEDKMDNFPGGKEFARELFNTAGSSKAIINSSKTVVEQSRLDPSDQILSDKVDLYMSDPPLRKSVLDNQTEKTFNCVKLSPMLCGYIESSTVFTI